MSESTSTSTTSTAGAVSTARASAPEQTITSTPVPVTTTATPAVPTPTPTAPAADTTVSTAPATATTTESTSTTAAAPSIVETSVQTVATPPASTTPPATVTVPSDVTPVKTLTPQEIVDSRQLAIVNEMLVNYKKLLSAKITNAKLFQSAATDFAGVMTRVLNTPTPEILDAVWNFFVENAKGILQENIALSGVEVLATGVRQRTELAYTLFRKATTGVDISDTTVIRESALKTMLKSPKVVAYLVEKAKTVVKS